MFIYIYIYPIQIHHFSISAAVQNSGFFQVKPPFRVFLGQLKLTATELSPFWASTQQLPGFDAFFGNGTKALGG